MAKITMQDLAERLGVSRFTVSRALSGGSGVSEETRQRVKRMAEELGYIPVNSDRFRDHFKTRNILFMIRKDLLSDQHFWPMVIAGAESATKKRRLNLIISVIEPEEEIDGKLPPTFLQQNIDGALAVGEFHPAFLASLSKQKQPVILVDVDGSGYPDTVVTHDMQGGFMATKHLIDLGHREICFLGDTTLANSFYRRYQGFSLAIAQAGLVKRQLLPLGYQGWNNSEHKDRLIEAVNTITAFVCANDLFALNLIGFINDAGKKVPDDISVVGFDNINIAANSSPALTTIHVFKERMGERAIELLEWRIKCPLAPKETISIGVKFVQRASTAKSP